MKINKILSALFVAAIVAMSFNAKAAGPLKFGIKGGVTVNDLKFNEDIFKADNRCGYTIGLMTKFTAPIINIGFDASVMFTHRVTKVDGLTVIGTDMSQQEVYDGSIKSDYIEIPINFRWDIGLPVIGKFVSPFLTTGPDFSFLVSKQNVSNAWNKHTFDFAWNFVFGLMFVNKVQL
ncbi:MAG: PorT family protein, partial [Muribaculaceae bacterium]|nr:PorT family protein [Muribaculaceae bacterium]